MGRAPLQDGRGAELDVFMTLNNLSSLRESNAESTEQHV